MGEHIENMRNIVGNVTENLWEHDENFFFLILNSKSKPILPLFFYYQPGPIPLPKRVGTYLDFTSWSLVFIKKEEATSPTHERVIVQVLYNPQNWGPHLLKTPP